MTGATPIRDPGGTPGASLRRLLAGPETLVTPSAWDCLTARLLEEAGFPAITVSGAGVSVARLGLPDLGFAGLRDMADTVRAITRAVDVPVLADADTGFGNALSAINTLHELTAAGAAGMHLEDQTFPKRCGHLDGKSVIDVGEFIAKIRAVVDERPDPSFVIVARTDALATDGVDAAIDRARRCADAGADVVMVEAATTLKEVERIGREIDAPKLYNLATGGLGPRLTVAQLRDLGFDWIVMPALTMAAVVDGVRRMAAAALRDGDDRAAAATGFRPRGLFELAGLERWERLDARYAQSEREEASWA